MAIQQQNSRIQHHTITGTGLVPTIPTLTEDFSLNTWLATDLALYELGINSTDGRAWFRSDTAIVELATVNNNVFERQGDDIISVPNPANSPLIDPTIINGTTHTNSGIASIITGENNTNTGDNSFVGGSSNINNAQNTIIGGDNNESNAPNNIIAGKDNKGSENSLTFGKGNNNTFHGGMSGGGVGVYGSSGLVTMAAVTTNTTPTEMFLDTTGTKRFVLTDDMSFYVTISVLAVDTVTGDSKEFHGNGIIKNVAGTTSLVSSITLTSSTADTSMATATVSVTADNKNDNLLLVVTGITATTINWVSSIYYTKVKY